MKPFIAPGMQMEAPDGWFDASTYLMAGPPIKDGRASMVVTLARGVPDPGVTAYVDRQLPDLKKLQEFALQKRESARVAGMDAVILEFTWKQPAGPKLRQRQWYLWSGGSVHTLTATAPDEAFPPLAPVFAQMVLTFKPKSW